MPKETYIQVYMGHGFIILTLLFIICFFSAGTVLQYFNNFIRSSFYVPIYNFYEVFGVISSTNGSPKCESPSPSCQLATDLVKDKSCIQSVSF